MGDRNPKITENIKGCYIASKTMGDSVSFAVPKMDVSLKVTELHAKWVCEPFRSITTYVDLCNKMYGDIKSACVFKDCKDVGNYDHNFLEFLLPH